MATFLDLAKAMDGPDQPLSFREAVTNRYGTATGPTDEDTWTVPILMDGSSTGNSVDVPTMETIAAGSRVMVMTSGSTQKAVYIGEGSIGEANLTDEVNVAIEGGATAAKYIRFDESDGLHVGADGGGEVVIDDDSVDIVDADGNVNASFAAGEIDLINGAKILIDAAGHLYLYCPDGFVLSSTAPGTAGSIYRGFSVTDAGIAWGSLPIAGGMMEMPILNHATYGTITAYYNEFFRFGYIDFNVKGNWNGKDWYFGAGNQYKDSASAITSAAIPAAMCPASVKTAAVSPYAAAYPGQAWLRPDGIIGFRPTTGSASTQYCGQIFWHW